MLLTTIMTELHVVLFHKASWSLRRARVFVSILSILEFLSMAISNHRLISFADGKVTFRWRDSAHHNEQKLLTLSLDEFLRRFLLHLLPKRFVRIRNFGFLANRRRHLTLEKMKKSQSQLSLHPPNLDQFG